MLGIIFAGILGQLTGATLKERMRRFLLAFIIGMVGYIMGSFAAIGVGGEKGRSVLTAMPFACTAVALLPLGFWLFGYRRRM